MCKDLMKSKSLLKHLLNLGILTFLVAILCLTDQAAWAQGSENLLVSAAASLEPALKTIAVTVKYSQKITYNFGSSGALQQQIIQGAPVDIFISAGTKQMDDLEAKGLLAFRSNLLTNQLVLITPKNSSVKLTDFRQLLNPNVKKIAIAAPKSVPAGQYATEVLQRLGILEQVQPKFVLGNSVRFVLAAVESGEVDAGIVYITDAKGSQKVVIGAIAEAKYHSPIIYPIATIKSRQNPQAAQTYIQFLQSSEVQAIFKSYGFGVVNK
jgi:molybdate transport system substrate-binding protein